MVYHVPRQVWRQVLSRFCILCLRIPKTTNTNQPKSNQAIDKEKPSASETTKEAYQRYIAAYNKMTSLMAEGKGDTPAGQAAYQDYVKQKKIYEATNNK